MLLCLQSWLSHETKGVILCLIAYFCFTCGDAVIKVLGPHYSVLQIFLLKMVPSALMGFVVVVLTSNEKKSSYSPALVASDTRLTASDDAFFRNLHLHACEPLGSSYVLVFSALLIIVILAHFWLKENIRPQLWACVGIGFVGVVFVCSQAVQSGTQV